MTVYAWPNSRTFTPSGAQWRVIDNLQRNSESPLSGYVQTLSMPGAKWGWSFEFGGHDLPARAQIEAYLLRLSGRQHRVALWDIRHPRPAGQIALAGVTLASAAAQFATTVQLAGCTNPAGGAATLKANDWLGLPGGQLVRCVADASADGAGVMVVEVRHMLRSALGAGGAVTLDAPTALYVLPDANLSMPRQPGPTAPPITIDFTEVFA